METVDLKLKVSTLRRVFGRAEGRLMHGELVIFSERNYLASIFKQLPQELQDEFDSQYDTLVENLRNSGLL